jgi:hypothetical protein
MPFHAAEQRCQSSAVVYLPTKITGNARGLFESASGGRVSQRPVILSSTGTSTTGRPSDRLSFLFGSFSFGQAKKKNYKIRIFFIFGT